MPIVYDSQYDEAFWNYYQNENIDLTLYSNITYLCITSTHRGAIIIPSLKPLTELTTLLLHSEDIIQVTDYPDTLLHLDVRNSKITTLGILPPLLEGLTIHENNRLILLDIPETVCIFEAYNQSFGTLHIKSKISHLTLYKCKINMVVGLTFHSEMNVIQFTHCNSPYPSVLINRFMGVPVTCDDFKHILNNIHNINRNHAVKICANIENISNTIFHQEQIEPVSNLMAVKLFTNRSNYARRISEFITYI